MPQCSDCGADLLAVGDPWSGNVRCPHCDKAGVSIQRNVSLGKITLDSYEKMLAQSGDPADMAAVLIRQALKKVGIDPDKDEWHVVGEQWSVPEGSGITVEPCTTFYRPTVVKVDALPSTRPPWESNESATGLRPCCVCEDSSESYKSSSPCGDVYMHCRVPDQSHSVSWCGKCGHTRICCLTWCAERMESHAASAYIDLRQEARHHKVRKPTRRK